MLLRSSCSFKLRNRSSSNPGLSRMADTRFFCPGSYTSWKRRRFEPPFIWSYLTFFSAVWWWYVAFGGLIVVGAIALVMLARSLSTTSPSPSALLNSAVSSPRTHAASSEVRASPSLPNALSMSRMVVLPSMSSPTTLSTRPVSPPTPSPACLNNSSAARCSRPLYANQNAWRVCSARSPNNFSNCDFSTALANTRSGSLCSFTALIIWLAIAFAPSSPPPIFANSLGFRFCNTKLPSSRLA